MEYTVIRSRRRTLSLRIKADGALEVRAPLRMSNAAISAFVDSKRRWIELHQAKAAARKPLPLFTPEELAALKQQADAYFPGRVAFFAPTVGVEYSRVTIRAQHTLWGSCSGKGSLSFNCLLMLAPEQVQNYVIVHELCHRLEMNHSARFWAEVARVMPDYRQAQAWLKENGSALLRRLK